MVLPTMGRGVLPLWSVHLGMVAALGLTLVPRLWRSGTVRCGPPGVLICVALLSLCGATVWAHVHDLPRAERLWAGLTALSHCVFFLCALAMVPVRKNLADNPRNRGRNEVAPARRVRQILGLLLLGLVAVQAWTMVEQVGVNARPQGTLGNPNTLGAVIAAVGLALAAFARWRLVVLVPLAGLVVLLLLTSSRGAMAAMATMMLLLAARRSWRTVVILALTLGALLVFVPNPLWDRVLSLRSEDHYSRLFIWKVALQNIAENPWGIGASMNKYAFLPLAFDGEFPWLLHQRSAVGLTHNVFLTVTLEWGWLAGASLLTLAGWVGLRLSPRPRPESPGTSPARPVEAQGLGGERRGRDALGQGAVLGAGVLFLELQVDGLEQNALAFSVFLMLAAVTWQRARTPSVAWRVGGRKVAVALAGVSLLLGYHAVDHGRVLTAQQRAGLAINAWITGSGDLETARAELAWLQARAPDEPTTQLRVWQLNSRLLRLAERSGAVDEPAVLDVIRRGTAAIEAACELNPADPDLLANLADWRLRLWRLAQKPPHLLLGYMEAMEALLARDPLNVQARWDLAREAQRAGRFDLFENQLQDLFALEPDDALAWFVLGRLHTLEGRPEKALYAMNRAKEAVFNCRLKLAADSPGSHAYYTEILGQVDLARIRQAISQLRRELLL